MTDSSGTDDMTLVYLGLGSNLEDRMGNLEAAVGYLRQRLTIEQVSSVYETEPMGYEDQPLFLNAVMSAATELEPLEILRFVKRIESDLGRRPGFRNAPRPIDIDILFYGDRVIQSSELTIPHPAIPERAFVLVPLAEIAPGYVHPTEMKEVNELLDRVSGVDGVKLVGRLAFREAIG
jgi:2-amino-4-hydroxy-6-hydroxymethyldihydropteridine diphosphokinase